MVIHASALGRNGIHDWLLVRVSAIIMLLYTIYIIGFITITDKITYEIWYSLFSSFFTKFFTLLTLISILIHGWIGIWQVLTDYVKKLSIRLLLQIIIVIALLSYVIYGTIVIWSV
ncbi:succinate dehydrogenase membrane anchor subunit [Pantoea sp. Aalb]|uniref:succinate dehydrogenase membrane anchor subunit n=1 Tax=Pantoea sp. Aalb TaxID=2576762 RepID=UPI00132A7ECB|nr:succinate dehydrogenase membrane anchor subunit [Pantoea sp. Aalb]MXP67537.1 succinate dehydrogenase membrane anchor subunit [Pantoea sp. Aalb]